MKPKFIKTPDDFDKDRQAIEMLTRICTMLEKKRHINEKTEIKIYASVIKGDTTKWDVTMSFPAEKAISAAELTLDTSEITKVDDIISDNGIIALVMKLERKRQTEADMPSKMLFIRERSPKKSKEKNESLAKRIWKAF
jgi:hypothetical protein